MHTGLRNSNAQTVYRKTLNSNPNPDGFGIFGVMLEAPTLAQLLNNGAPARARETLNPNALNTLRASLVREPDLLPTVATSKS